MKHLMIFSIGPVQDFIATARRSRDLWYGSWMLSEVSKAAAKKIGELSPPGELIFPCPSKPNQLDSKSEFNAPNKIVAVIDGDPRAVVLEIRKEVDKRVGELWADARTHVKGKIDDQLAQKQIDDLLEFYWVSVPYNKDTIPYSSARDSAEALFAARKITRDFRQATGNSYPKSSLDGARESVIPKQEYPERKDTEDVKREKAENLYKHYHARPGEQLSGVDILKRLGDPDNSPKFKSTSDVAALPFLEGMNQKMGVGKGSELISEIRTLLPQDFEEIDGTNEGLVFESRFLEWADTQPSANELRKKFTEVLRKYASDAKPNPYYALLAADGDNMGLAIDAQTDPEKHRELSQVLSGFAAQVKEFVKTSNGVLIYAGGDDVLAYMPLHKVLDFARQIEEDFKQKTINFKSKDGVSPTLSVGIAVTHHLEPLSDALELARKAEKEAKSVPGKNGLAIIVSKRSGADRTIKDKFAVLDERLQKLIHFSESDAISAGAAYELQDLHRTLSGMNIPTLGLAKEALRIIGRKREAGSVKDIQSEIKKAFEVWLTPPEGTQVIPLDELALEMIVANMFAVGEAKETV